MTEHNIALAADDAHMEVPVDIPLNEELESEGAMGPDVDTKAFTASIANQPLGFRLGDLFRKLGKPDPDIVKLYSRFDIFMIPHTLAIMRRSGMAEPTELGLEVEYDAGGRTCSVVSLFPVFQYQVQGSVSSGVRFAARMSPTGELAAMGEAPAGSGASLSLGGLTLSASADSAVELHLSAVVSTPTVQATGKNSSQCAWNMVKQKEPLFGRDIETWAAVVLAKGSTALQYRIRFYVITRTFMFPTRIQSDWVERTCQFV
jgi:hypothetical protein